MKIVIDNQLGGYNTFNQKIPPMLKELRKMLGNKIFKSEEPLQIYGGSYSRDTPYSYEIFSNNGSIIIMEITYDDWNPKIASDVSLNIHNPKTETVNSIRELMRKYPHHSKELSEYAYFAEYNCCPICGSGRDKHGIGEFRGIWKKGKCPNCGWNFKSAKTTTD